ncbi:zinc finger MYND domain-containing protein 12 [Gracilinanus agilis]|uniref:zinc finger MYND domain-containing protein 12 n=1 Tax=Gracilinanus agilis TaxID=191870 RepID=UPI001CFE9338|nr:zinc finger MYND domain-containing protein 12 [Gracilinanus agilis]
MTEIYPLAVPKGRKLKCEVCEAPAERMCAACTVTYYCGTAHQRADWASIHEKICQLLIPLRTTMPFYNSEEERRHGREQLLQRQIYFASCVYGSEDIRTSGGYFLMGNVFIHQNKMDIADSLYTKVTEIWHTYLDQHIQNQLTARKKPADILAKELENDTGLDEAQEAEAVHILETILEIREHTDKDNPQNILFILKTVAILHYLMMNLSKAHELAVKAYLFSKELPNKEDITEALRDLLGLIASKDPVTLKAAKFFAGQGQ